MLKQLQEIFSKDYARETFYRKKTAEALDIFRLKNKSENIEDKIDRLRKSGYKSDLKQRRTS